MPSKSSSFHAFAKRSLHLKSTHAAVADDGIGRPEQWMCVSEYSLAVDAEIARPIGQRHHRLPQSLSTCQFPIIRLPLEQIGDEFARRLRMNRPVGDKKRPRAGIEERAAKARGGFCPGSRSCSRVA